MRPLQILLLCFFLPGIAYSQLSQFQQEVKASDDIYSAHFGAAVDIYGDVAVVGAPFEKKNALGQNPVNNSGAVYIYTKNANDSWIQTQKICPEVRGWSQEFGTSVSIYGDYILVGAPEDKRTATGNGSMHPGSAYVFKKVESGNWEQWQVLSASSPHAYGEFGRSVSMQDGEMAIGFPGHEVLDSLGNDIGVGAVVIYRLNDTGFWEENQIVTIPDNHEDERFGKGVALNGNHLIGGVGNRKVTAMLDFSYRVEGACIFHKNSEGIWIDGQSIYSVGSQNYLGFGDALDINSEYAVVGVPKSSNSAYLMGSVDVYKADNAGIYSLYKRVKAEDYIANMHFGKSVALYGNMLFTGAERRNDSPTQTGYNDLGAVYSYDLDAQNEQDFATLVHLPDTRYPYAFYGAGLAVQDNQMIVGAPYVLEEEYLPWRDLTKSGTAEIFSLYKVSGFMYQDQNGNCSIDVGDVGIPNVQAVINPGGILVETDSTGNWYLDELPAGNYTISSGDWLTFELTCENNQPFTVANSNELTLAPSIGYINKEPCAMPNVSVVMPAIRPCFEDLPIILNVCNDPLASAILENPYVDFHVDSLIQIQSANYEYEFLGPFTVRFSLDDLNIGACIAIVILADVDCAAELGMTVCMEANLFPVESCVFDAGPGSLIDGSSLCELPYDGSDIDVSASCLGDSIQFNISNAGNGGMACYSHYRVFRDGQLLQIDSVILESGDHFEFSIPSDGYTYHLQANQHANFPVIDNPIAFVEGCGDLSNWTSGLVSVFPANDESPVVDVFCGIVSGSFDPNDKKGFPIGVGQSHNILPNTKLEYLVRFQNTGTDTAFTVVVVDTLDVHLDLFSVQAGAASHDYKVTIEEGNILRWEFENILLPDSNRDELGSHGFLSYEVQQADNLENGTIIENSASIFFDFNDPIFTNTTFHQVQRNLGLELIIPPESPENPVFPVHVFPNPSSGTFSFEFEDQIAKTEIKVFSLTGELILSGIFYNQRLIEIDLKAPQGMYVARIQVDGATDYVKLIQQ